MKRIYLLCLLAFILSRSAFSQQWDSVGPHMSTYNNIEPDVLYADSSYLYMAGRFHLINGMHMQGIARWNGVKWDSMGAGIDRLIMYDTGRYNPSHTWAITHYHNKLYVGGGFSSVGYLNAPGIGTWNGIAWDTIPVQPFKNESYMGSTGDVDALTVINNKLYMGGEFDTVAGKPCRGIACWNDTNWSSLNFGQGFSFELIDAICEYQGSIYAAGHFAGNNGGIGEIIRLDSAGNWHSVDTGIKGTMDWINKMAVYNGELYVGGYFYKSDGNVGNNIQRWNGTSWNDVGGGTDHQIENLLVYHGKLYAMGVFTEAGGVPVDGIAEWDGTKWCSIDSVTTDNADPGAAATYKDSLYVGGDFWTIDGSNISFIAEWVDGNYVANCGQPTGVNQLKINNEQLKIYPNPNNGQFTLSLSNLTENCNVEIYNVLGEKVYTDALPQSQSNINLTGQPNGVYLIRVNERNTYLTQKIVKEN